MYDPGSDTLNSNAIALHRNENLFVNKDFLRELYTNASQDLLLNTYPEASSYQLRAELAKKHHCSPEEIYIGNGADGVLADLFQHFRSQYDEIGLQDYTYQVYPYLCSRYKFQIKNYSQTSQLWVIDSPNSINGNTFDFSTIKSHPDFLIWDNVYGDFDKNNPSPILDCKNTLRINSFSKFYGLASLRIGYCIGDKELIKTLLSKKDIFNVNAAAQKIALLALKNHDYFASLVPKIESSKCYLSEELIKLGFTVEAGKANFIWIMHPQKGAKEIQQNLQRDGIIVRHFNAPKINNGLRIAIPPIDLAEKVVISLKNLI